MWVISSVSVLPLAKAEQAFELLQEGADSKIVRSV
jgi:hypothetical protein